MSTPRLIIFLSVFLLTISTSSISSYQYNSVDIDIFAGENNRYLGFGVITINITNNLAEDITVFYNSTFDHVYGMAIPYFYFENTTVESMNSKEMELNIRECIGDGWYPIVLYNVDILVETEGQSILRKGISFRQIIFFYR